MDGLEFSFLKNMNVLYVEDDDSLAMQTVKLLEYFFHTVTYCDNAEAALDLFTSKLFHLVITDIGLPGINGLQLCEEIRKIDQQIPIFITTIYDDKEKLLQAVKLNLVDYLIKPVSITSIQKTLLEALRRITTSTTLMIFINPGRTYNPLLGQIEVSGDPMPIPLSQKEIKLLNLLLQHKNKILPRETIEDVLYSDAPLTDSSYKSLIFRLRKKIGKDSITSLSGAGIKLNIVDRRLLNNPITHPYTIPQSIPSKRTPILSYLYHFSNMHLLLVDDSDENREVAGTLLKKMGADVDEAGNGEIAIEMIRKKRYDLVFMDIQMPNLDGLSAARALRNEGFTDLLIIALSGHTSQTQRQCSLDAGMNDHLSKPYTLNSLQSLLVHWLPDKIDQKIKVPDSQTSSWVSELPVTLGLVLSDEMSNYWLHKEDFLHKLKHFIHNTVEEYNRLHTMIDKKNISTALKSLHKIKGGVKLYGANHLYEIIEQLETLLNEDDDANVSDLLHQFNAAIAELTA